MPLESWVLYYLVPAGIGTYFKNKQTSLRNSILVIHEFVLLSIILLSFIGIRLQLNFNILSAIMIVVAIVVTFYLLGKFGLLFLISGAIQEYSLLLASAVIVGSYGVILSAILTSIPYTISHYDNSIIWSENLKIFSILFLWGLASIILYFWIHQPSLNIAIHTIGGAILIYSDLLYRKPTRSIV